MSAQDVCFLYPCRVTGGSAKSDMRQLGSFTAGLSGKGDGERSEVPCRFNGSTYVPAVTGGCDPDNNIVLRAERLDLSAEDLVITIVVTDAREDRSIGCEGDGWKPSSLPAEPSYELGSEVLRVRSASTVAALTSTVAVAEPIVRVTLTDVVTEAFTTAWLTVVLVNEGALTSTLYVPGRSDSMR